MRYQIPIEAPRNRYANLAVRATAPYWTALFAGALPGVVWALANAFFLDCRDRRRQLVVGAVMYSVFMALGALRFWLYRSGTFEVLFGHSARLFDALMTSLNFLIVLGTLRYFAARQIDVAEYRSSLGAKLPWGLPLAIALILFEYFVVPSVYRWFPSIYWIWGPLFL